MSYVRRFDHVGLTVADLDVVTAFFVALGLEVEGRTRVAAQLSRPAGGTYSDPMLDLRSLDLEEIVGALADQTD
jgi:catechol 2,3-dioxygenase-like lactoylglutathione lyase family enzyme